MPVIERRGKGALPLLPHTCKYCNVEFLAKPLSRFRLYCGRSCQAKAIIRGDSRKRSLCTVCSKEFLHYGERIVCSRECLAVRLSQTRIGENNPAFIADKVTVVCKQCTNTFQVSRNGLHKNQQRMFCSIRCCHLFQTGKSKTGEPATYPYAGAFKRTKKQIKDRDGNKCVLCASSEKLHVHHIDYSTRNDTDDNLITLCRRCHMLTNFERGFWQILFAALISGSTLVRKGWGAEIWITNTPDYCLKYLILYKDKMFSLHSHAIKKELWHCLFGKLECLLTGDGVEPDFHIIRKGDKVEIAPKLVHQLHALENSIIIEVSTQHFDNDSYRVQRGD